MRTLDVTDLGVKYYFPSELLSAEKYQLSHMLEIVAKCFYRGHLD